MVPHCNGCLKGESCLLERAQSWLVDAWRLTWYTRRRARSESTRTIGSAVRLLGVANVTRVDPDSSAESRWHY